MGVSFYGGGGRAGSANVGITAKTGTTSSPIKLFLLEDGNYNLIGTVIHGDNQVLSFLSYKYFQIETIDGIKYAAYTEIKDDKIYDVLIKMTAENVSEVIRMERKPSAGSCIDDSTVSSSMTYSSAKIVELLAAQQESTNAIVEEYLAWTT